MRRSVGGSGVSVGPPSVLLKNPSQLFDFCVFGLKHFLEVLELRGFGDLFRELRLRPLRRLLLVLQSTLELGGAAGSLLSSDAHARSQRLRLRLCAALGLCGFLVNTLDL